MSRYLTLVVRLADNADAMLVFEQVERINGVALSASSWSHALDARDILATGIERKQMECDRLRDALEAIVADHEFCGDKWGDRSAAWIETARAALSAGEKK